MPVGLWGCGTENASEPAQSGTAPSSSAPSSSAPSSSAPSEPETSAEPDAVPSIDADVIRVVSASNVGGRVSQRAVAVAGAPGVRRLTKGLDGRMVEEVEATVRDIRAAGGSGVMGAIVSVSCEHPEPAEITVVEADEGYVVIGPKPDKSIQCLVPVTSIALFPTAG